MQAKRARVGVLPSRHSVGAGPHLLVGCGSYVERAFCFRFCCLFFRCMHVCGSAALGFVPGYFASPQASSNKQTTRILLGMQRKAV